MRILHTGDWHLGKVSKGISRLEEQRAVMAELVAVAGERQVDLVVVAGDVFESAAPPPDAQALAWSTLLGLRATGSEVVVVAGNHDSPHQFDAVAPVFAAAGVHVVGRPRRPDDGGVLTAVAPRTGEAMVVACLPFVSQRAVVTSEQLMHGDGAAAAATYAERYQRLVDALCAAFTPNAVNVVVAHTTVRGGTMGGGEREAQSIFDYTVPAVSFPAGAHYVALGHLHRTQPITGPCPIWYSGSPLQVDFGEERDTKAALLVEARPGTPAAVEVVPLHAGRRLLTLRGSLAELRAFAGTTGDAYLRIVVREPARVGLADHVRDLFPLAIDVRVEHEQLALADASASLRGERSVRSPTQLFGQFLATEGIADPRLDRLFAELLDQVAEAH